MLGLVELHVDLFPMKVLRVTLVTKITGGGELDKIGMMIIGHPHLRGYERYNRTKVIRMEGATFAFARFEVT